MNTATKRLPEVHLRKLNDHSGTLSVRLPPETLAAFKEYARKAGVTVSSLVAVATTDWINRNGGSK